MYFMVYELYPGSTEQRKGERQGGRKRRGEEEIIEMGDSVNN